MAFVSGIKETAASKDYATALLFYTRSTVDIPLEKARLTSDGKLGIGLTPIQQMDIKLGGAYGINGILILSATTLGSSVINSSLQTVGTIGVGTWNASTITVSYGGTGATTFTSNGVLYGNGTSVIQVTAQGPANSVLTANAGAPSFSATPTITSINLAGISNQAVFQSAGVTGTLTWTPLTTNKTITIPNVTSTLAVYSDNLSVFAATTSAQLAGVISDETGSGALVFGTTPTFTTNITAPLVIGGTGTTSTLSLRSTSGGGAAGADIIFQVGNNGAIEAMRILNNGNVGIGTASPGKLLDVVSTGGFQPRIRTTVNSTAGLLFSNSAYSYSVNLYDSVANSFQIIDETAAGRPTRVLIDSGGNVGIGTTSPGSLLQVYSTSADVVGTFQTTSTTKSGQFKGQADTAAIFGGALGSAYGGTTFAGLSGNNQAVLEAQSSSSFYIGTLTAAPIVFAQNRVEKVRIDSGGNVGIGTTSPNANALLDVSSTTKAFMPPRMTTTQRDNIASPTAGMVIYNSTTNKLNVYTTAWEAVTSA